MKLTNILIDYHRNGISGEGFYVATFSWYNVDTKRTHHMVGTIFAAPGQCAILDIDELSKDNITFARGNSWRGDRFEPELRQAIQRYNDELEQRLSKPYTPKE